MQASLPIRLEGHGLCSALSSYAAAFVSSCNANCHLVKQLLGYLSKSLSSGFVDDTSFISTLDMVKIQGEVVMKDQLCQQLSSVLPATFPDLSVASQNHCSNTLTEFNWRLEQECSIRD